jgi:hypothetical protein
MATNTSRPVLRELRWNAKVNGKKHFNGTRYGITLKGVVEVKDPTVSIYLMAQSIAAHIQEEAAEMGHPDSLQITILPLE